MINRSFNNGLVICLSVVIFGMFYKPGIKILRNAFGINEIESKIVYLIVVIAVSCLISYFIQKFLLNNSKERDNARENEKTFVPDNYIHNKNPYSYEATEYYLETGRPYSEFMNDKGCYGEYQAYSIARNLNCYKKFLFNCYIPLPDGRKTEIDMVILSEYFLIMVEVKNYNATVIGSISNQKWTKRCGYEVYDFYNPVYQNRGHINAFYNFAASYFAERNELDFLDNVEFQNYVCFSNNTKLFFSDELPRYEIVGNMTSFSSFINKMSEHNGLVKKITPQQIDILYNLFYECSHYSDEEAQQTVEENNRILSEKYGYNWDVG